MKIEQRIWTPEGGWRAGGPGGLGAQAQLVLLFWENELFHRDDVAAEVRKAYPRAHLAGCSTAGEIIGPEVLDEALTVTAIHFESAAVQAAGVTLRPGESSRAAGQRLAAALDAKHLVHVLVFSDGLQVNGSELVAGLTAGLPPGVSLTGGLSADGPRFKSTRVLLEGRPRVGAVAAIGLSGDRLRVGYGSLGGWDPFGPERTITRSAGNVLYELDGRSALDLYKLYLGDYARDLPSSGLLFPLLVRAPAEERGVVRTILAVDEHAQSMTFAGDMPSGAYARLMRANFDRLIDGAAGAARVNQQALAGQAADLAILISCVGRKLVLGQRTEEEVDAVRDVLGADTALTGFYSYGEISPMTPGARCELHNQTMTITTMSEI